MTNEELMRQISARNMDAVELLYEKNENMIRDIAKECAADFEYLQRKGKRFTAYTKDILRDLRAEGALAFYERIQSGEYDPAKGRLTTYLHPYIKGAMYRWLERQARYQEHTVSMDDLVQDEDGDQLEFPIVDKDARSPASVVYRKICGELLEELFEQLSAKDKSILGHTYGVYGYEGYTTDELALKEMLTPDAVVKARRAALRRLRKSYEGSRLQVWQRVYRLVMKT